MYAKISDLEWNFKNGNVTKEAYVKQLKAWKEITDQFTDDFESYVISKLLKEVEA
jgi:hypothetical protein|nr:MAG TPA: hypothetical protein [Caudoviricetes sp.]